MKKVLGLLFVVFILLLSITLVSCNRDASSSSGMQDDTVNEDRVLTAVEIYEKINPSVACIFSLDVDGNISSGSAFFIDINGTLVTNYHIIKNAISIIISMYDNEKDSNGNWYKAISVLGVDKDLDIAILQTNKANSIPVKLNFGEVTVGEQVYAIGYPESFKLGWEESTFSKGMITKKSMEIDGHNYIQSDVNITHGNSGGVLLNEKGKVIGITSSGIRLNDIDYMNLSIPAEKITYLSHSLYWPIEDIPYYYLELEHSFYEDGVLCKKYEYKYGANGTTPREPSKVGYTFLGWRDNQTGALLKSTNFAVTRSKRFDAEYKANEYEIVLDVFDNDSSHNYVTTIEFDEMKVLPVPTRIGYIFKGWYEDYFRYGYHIQITTEDGQMMNRWNITYDTRLYAKWESIYYDVNIDINNSEAGSVYTRETACYNENVQLQANTNDGYIWIGWFENGKLLSHERIYSFIMPNSNVYYEAKWSKMTLTKNIDNAGTITNLNGKYCVGDIVTIEAVPNAGFSFKGWYLDNQLFMNDAEISFQMLDYNINLDAMFEANTYNLTINNLESTIEIIGEGSYLYGSKVTLKATGINYGKTVEWIVNDEVVNQDHTYTFIMGFDVVVTTRLIDASFIYFGYYPQSEITDANLINLLNTKTGDLPTKDNRYSWTRYGYSNHQYSSGPVYMWYQDVQYENEKYRGVYFTNYRNRVCCWTDYYYYYQVDDNYLIGIVFWFKWEPIKWDIVTSEDGKTLVITDIALDSQPFDNSYSPKIDSSPYEHNGGTGYPSAYRLSSIRKWLNDKFYNSSFTNYEQNIIQNTRLNDVSSNDMIVDDKVFLLSYNELVTYNLDRTISCTQYADSQGCSGSFSKGYGCEYWCRNSDGNQSDVINSRGEQSYVNDIFVGVRPSLWINLQL